MSYINPLQNEFSKQEQDYFDLIEQAIGFVPNSLKTMARWPELLQAFSGLSATIVTGALDPQLRALVSLVASSAGGCRYCQAHTAHTANHSGVSLEKIQAAFTYQQNAIFSGAEQSALRFAHHAASHPNAVCQSDIDELQQHFSERDIIELQAVVSLFAWLNRWNDSMATELEAAPKAFAEQALASEGWVIDKH